ncbi:alpha/beta fold hydrolase [Paraburkholderia sp. EG287A]|uniref:alpha/beta fold hydrolase n=1 Tax=unclassified Paraburkholderia TaxID=2615204 RepID=UPI0034D369E9
MARIAFGVPITHAALRTKPNWALVATADRAINPDLERFMTQRAGSKTVEINSSHVAYMSHPAEVAKLIEQAAAQSSKE